MSKDVTLFVPGALWKRPPPPVKKPLRQLNPEEQARVARNKASVCIHMPDMVPFIKELHEAGMIDGWRGVGEVVFIDIEGQNTARTMITLEGNEHVTT